MYEIPEVLTVELLMNRIATTAGFLFGKNAVLVHIPVITFRICLYNWEWCY